ncbi:MAG TPA: OB-fold nucleic acid binding domain-containing protein, partial [Chthonomonadales bacterium]|nr:OB-fold nucleic acid binding domain-containing protein [Chthonomonadales bacterium]
GVIVYQDQVMQIAQAIAGFSLGQADVLRRAMGKKKKEEMVKARASFLAGAKSNDVPEKVAREIFELVEPFAGYAFNKAHSVCYAMVAYQTAYMKANYPVEYMAALMACSIEKPDKLATCMEECARMGISVLPPDVNASGADYTIEQVSREHASEQEAEPRAIRYGLAAIKNIGRASVDAILSVRAEGGRFHSLSDFCLRVLSSAGGGVNRSAIETLIQAGAFSQLEGHNNRRALCQSLDSVCQAAGKLIQEQRDGQGALTELFGGASVNLVHEAAAIPYMPEYPLSQILAFERDLLGTYITAHPLRAHSERFRRKQVTELARLPELPERTEVQLGGIITAVKPFTSKKSGEPMAFFTLEDTTGFVACTMFPSIYAQYGASLVKDKIVLLRGRTSFRERVRHDSDGGHVVEILVDAVDLQKDDADGTSSDGAIHIRLDSSKRLFFRHVRDAVQQHRGGKEPQEVWLHIRGKQRTSIVRTDLVAEFSDKLRSKVETLLGKQALWRE